MSVEHIGNAVFVGDPITPSEWEGSRDPKWRKRWKSKTQEAIAWLDRVGAEEGLSIRPYVDFPSLERAYIGVALVLEHPPEVPHVPEQEELWRDLPHTVGRKEILESIELKNVPYFEPLSQYSQASDLEFELRRESRSMQHVFEEYPMVEVGSKKEWKLLLRAHELSYGRERSEEYRGPGIYDARDMTKAYESAEEIELSDMEQQADELVDYMFSGGLLSSDLQGNEWAKAFEELARRAASEEDEGGESD